MAYYAPPPPAGAASVSLGAASDLPTRPQVAVALGPAPDGVPWVCEIDRSTRLAHLNHTVAALFDVAAVEQLPPAVREVVEGRLAGALMGVQEVALTPGASTPAYVARTPARGLFGSTLLQRLLDPAGSRTAAEPLREAVTAAVPAARADALDAAVAAAQSGRHVLVAVDGTVWTGTVADADRALRTPLGPFRRAVFESLAAFEGATATVEGGGCATTVPTADLDGYRAALGRAARRGHWVSVRHSVPRAAVAGVVAAAAGQLGDLHRQGRVHGDLNPSNVLVTAGGPQLIDSLDLAAGDIAAAATFEWAAPEQVVGRALDARADVYGVGRMLCALLGAVPYGEKVAYVVPTGGGAARTVPLLKTDGVYLDADPGAGRDYRRRWQDTLLSLVAHHPQDRLPDGAAAAQALRILVAELPPRGDIHLDGAFGRLATVEDTDGGAAWLVTDS